MQDRFRFNAIVTSYYYIEEEGKEVEPQIYLKDVDLHSNGEISVSQDNLEKAIRKQYPDLKNSYIALIMEFFQNNSNHTEPLLLTPDKVLQCTGLKDKTGKLIYEGDIIYKKGSKNYKKEKMYSRVCWDSMYAQFNISDENGMHQMPSNSNNIEIIGNIYENPELLEVVK